MILSFGKSEARISYSVTAQWITAFGYASWIVHSLLLLNPKFLAYSHICGGTLQFVSYLIGNTDDRFCCDVAYINVIIRAVNWL